MSRYRLLLSFSRSFCRSVMVISMIVIIGYTTGVKHHPGLSKGGAFKSPPLLEHSINEVDGFLLLLIYDFRIDFSGLSVGVTHQLACGEQVCAKCQHHCAEGVT